MTESCIIYVCFPSQYKVNIQYLSLQKQLSESLFTSIDSHSMMELGSCLKTNGILQDLNACAIRGFMSDPNIMFQETDSTD